MKERDPWVGAIAVIALIYSSTAAAMTWGTSLALVGVPIPVVFMAFAGASAGLIVQKPVSVGRLAMFGLTVGFTFIATCGAIVLAATPWFKWTRDAQPAIAGVLSFFAQTLVPAASLYINRRASGRGATDQGGSPP